MDENQELPLKRAQAPHGRNAALVLATSVLCLVVAGGFWRALRSDQPEPAVRFADALPAATIDETYVSSDRCRACHPSQYASWHDTYHRTMTQPAAPDTIVAPFDGRLVGRGPTRYRVLQRGDTFWVGVHDARGARVATRAREERQVVMVTGSHHQQRFWLAGDSPRRLDLLPLAYLIAEDRWVPGEAIFLVPPQARQQQGMAEWNRNCVKCHSTGGRFRPAGERVTEVGELGIACEACHGPAAEHVAANQDPLRRYWLHSNDEPDPTIVNPRRLPSKRAAEVCGQCHGLKALGKKWVHEGLVYKPGQELEEDGRYFIRYTSEATEPWHKYWLEGKPTRMERNFWADGTIRVSGREHNGLLESPCFQRGELSCLSCHSMHSSDPNLQLDAGMDGDAACADCHAPARYAAESHTHHPAESAGARCYNCHMPYTTYGLLRTLRSHRIDSPSVANSVASGRPNACNLCHTDQTLAWTDRYLGEWYQTAPTGLTEDQEKVSAALLWLLQGDAVQRAVTAWNLGWEPALEASGRDWQAPFLAELLKDPYAAVRFNAQRSIRNLPGHENLQHDYLADGSQRSQDAMQVREAWARRSVGRVDAEVLMTEGGGLDYAELERLIAGRNDEPAMIHE